MERSTDWKYELVERRGEARKCGMVVVRTGLISTSLIISGMFLAYTFASAPWPTVERERA